MRALVVGYGRMGRFHAKVLTDHGYEVLTVDPDLAAGADYLSLLGVLPRRVDVAVASCPAVDLLDAAYHLAGVPMLVEKPFATNLRDARLLAAYLASFAKPVAVGFVERFNPVVQQVRDVLADGEPVDAARFTRWSDRPSWDERLDLLLHDVDLVRWLGIRLDRVEFDVRSGSDRKVRTIEITRRGEVTTFDLMAHDRSPLHDLWDAFLRDDRYPGPGDAIRAQMVLPYVRTRERVGV